MTVYLPKEEAGKFFPDLDMISKLMFPAKKDAPGISLAAKHDPDCTRDDGKFSSIPFY